MIGKMQRVFPLCDPNAGGGAKLKPQQQNQHPQATPSNSHVAAHDSAVAGIPPDVTNAKIAVPVTAYPDFTGARESIVVQQAFLLALP